MAEPTIKFGDAELARNIIEKAADGHNGLEFHECSSIGIDNEKCRVLVKVLDNYRMPAEVTANERVQLSAAGFSDEFIQELAGSDGRHPMHSRAEWLAKELSQHNTWLRGSGIISLFKRDRFWPYDQYIQEAGKMGPDGAPAAKVIAGYLTNPDFLLYNAVTALEAMGSSADEGNVVSSLLSVVANKDVKIQTRLLAIQALASIRPSREVSAKVLEIMRDYNNGIDSIHDIALEIALLRLFLLAGENFDDPRVAGFFKNLDSRPLSFDGEEWTKLSTVDLILLKVLSIYDDRPVYSFYLPSEQEIFNSLRAAGKRLSPLLGKFYLHLPYLVDDRRSGAQHAERLIALGWQAAPFLISRLSSDLQGDAAMLLLSAMPKESMDAVPHLINLLGKRSTWGNWNREILAETLAIYAREGAEVAPLLERVLAEGNMRQQEDAILVAGLMKKQGHSLRNKVKSFLDSDNESFRSVAATALVHISNDSFEAALSALQGMSDEAEEVRLAAFSAFEEFVAENKNASAGAYIAIPKLNQIAQAPDVPEIMRNRAVRLRDIIIEETK